MWKLIKAEFEYNALFLFMVFGVLFLYSLILLFGNISPDTLSSKFELLLVSSFLLSFIYPLFIRFKEKRDSGHFMLSVSKTEAAAARILVLILPWIIIQIYFLIILFMNKTGSYSVPILQIWWLLILMIIFIIARDLTLMIPIREKQKRSIIVSVMYAVFILSTTFILVLYGRYIVNSFPDNIIKQGLFLWTTGFVLTLLLSLATIYTFNRRRSFHQ